MFRNGVETRLDRGAWQFLPRQFVADQIADHADQLKFFIDNGAFRNPIAYTVLTCTYRLYAGRRLNELYGRSSKIGVEIHRSHDAAKSSTDPPSPTIPSPSNGL
jgi:hypothetical protein